MPPSPRLPRSAPALTTSFSLPSVLANYPPSPANPNVIVKEWSGTYASLSRRTDRWTLDVGGENDDQGYRSSEDVLKVRNSPLDRSASRDARPSLTSFIPRSAAGLSAWP